MLYPSGRVHLVQSKSYDLPRQLAGSPLLEETIDYASQHLPDRESCPR